MLGLLSEFPLAFAIVFPVLLLSITFHEFAHCWITDRLGDPTPRANGRLTLDPRAHLDPMGVVMILLTNFGWGKPAPFDPYNLRNPVRDAAIIAAAGPTSNLFLAAIAAILLKLSLVLGILPFVWWQMAMVQIILINVSLAVFNLVPVHPLDGSKILMALLPRNLSYDFEIFMRRYGTVVLIMLLIPWGSSGSPIGSLLSPVISFITNLLISFM
ncbi:MAG: site-2 protease family protein [Patescibacteria group bacterium]